MAVIPFLDALQKILLPLQEQVERLWHEGRLGVATEHYVTKYVQQKMFAATSQLPLNEFGPQVVVACPSEEEHEIPAQAVAYLCSARGCQVSYLGGKLPVAELAAFCRLVEPKFILLSLTIVPTPESARGLSKNFVPIDRSAVIIAGGAAAQAERTLLEQAGISVLDNLLELDRRLSSLITLRPLDDKLLNDLDELTLAFVRL